MVKPSKLKQWWNQSNTAIHKTSTTAKETTLRFSAKKPNGEIDNEQFVLY